MGSRTVWISYLRFLGRLGKEWLEAFWAFWPLVIESIDTTDPRHGVSRHRFFQDYLPSQDQCR